MENTALEADMERKATEQEAGAGAGGGKEGVVGVLSTAPCYITTGLEDAHTHTHPRNGKDKSSRKAKKQQSQAQQQDTPQHSHYHTNTHTHLQRFRGSVHASEPLCFRPILKIAGRTKKDYYFSSTEDMRLKEVPVD